MTLRISLPYSVYAVPTEDPWVRGTKPVVNVSLAKNSQLRTGARNQALIRAAKRQLAQDTSWLTQGALIAVDLGPPPYRMHAVITCRTMARRDDDGAVVALYPARDAIAEVLGINDALISVGTITFRKGAPEETEITLHKEEDWP